MKGRRRSVFLLAIVCVIFGPVIFVSTYAYARTRDLTVDALDASLMSSSSDAPIIVAVVGVVGTVTARGAHGHVVGHSERVVARFLYAIARPVTVASHFWNHQSDISIMSKFFFLRVCGNFPLGIIPEKL